MKKLILFLCILAGTTCFAQDKNALKEITQVKFYGIDYSLAQVYGVSETPAQLLTAFNSINNLFISEPKKFDVEKHLGKKVDNVSLEAVNNVNKTINPDNLITTNKQYALTPEAIAMAIKVLPITDKSGTGVVLIAELMNKPEERATYQIVFFDTQTKEIITSWLATGKAKGFGLRNYWAGSVYSCLKHIK